jgi:LmbE family N-acetylglucosaminyl deacetylase
VVAARDPHFFRDDIESSGIEHHRPRTMLLWEADEPDHGEDISATVETKIRALLAHESQFESTMKAVSPDEIERFATRMRERLTRLGQRIDRPAAEIFKKISDL